MLIQPKPITVGATVTLYQGRKGIRCKLLEPRQGSKGPDDIILTFEEIQKTADGATFTYVYTIAEFERKTKIPVAKEVWEFFAAKATAAVAEPDYNLDNLLPVRPGENYAEAGSRYILVEINPNSTPDNIQLVYQDEKGKNNLMQTDLLRFARATNRRLELKPQ